MDGGQAVVSFRGRIVSVEGRAGTDALISSAPGPGAVLVKVVKPGQDRRFDLPSLGPSSVICASMVGIRAIGIEAGGVLLFNKEKILTLCNRLGISLLGFTSKQS